MAMPKPIIFSGPMVRAILDDQKTATRRILKPQPPEHVHQVNLDWLRGGHKSQDRYGFSADNIDYASPYGGPGERLRVRETWAVCSRYDHLPPSKIPRCDVRYAATDETEGLRKRTPIHMPNWMSHITLLVTTVRVERLHQMNESDAIDEGITFDYPTGDRNVIRFAAGRMPDLSDPSSAIEAYRHIWDVLNAKRGFSWESNPWVWVVRFRRITG